MTMRERISRFGYWYNSKRSSHLPAHQYLSDWYNPVFYLAAFIVILFVANEIGEGRRTRAIKAASFGIKIHPAYLDQINPAAHSLTSTG
jgi:hypothetical protein